MRAHCWRPSATASIIVHPTARHGLAANDVSDIPDRLNAALEGRYTIERELGRGGMAIVYLARDERHQRLVAMKVMLPEAVGEVGSDRFRRETQIAARLTHPNIVTVFDSGELDDIFFYVMPFIEGVSLADAIKAEGQLSIPEAVAITRQVAEALDYAHAEGVVHRDIKPANILLAQSRARTTRGGASGGSSRTPIVTDFGIARAMSGDGATKLTSTGMMVGTPMYMSPEQFGAVRPVDGRADQYSLACVLYEMLIGEPPFSGPNPLVVLARHTQDAVPSLRAVRPTIPDALEQVIFRALAKVPADRFETMADFADAVVAAAEGPIVYGTSDFDTPAAARSLVPTAESARQTTLPARRAAATAGLALVPAPVMPPTAPVGSRRQWLAPRRTALAVSGVSAIALLAVGALSWRALRASPPSSMRIAVLPFESSGPVQDSTFADGLTEEIISRLSGVPRLRVVARTTAMHYKGTQKTAKEIGKELNVERLVQGTVRWTPSDARQATISVSIVNTAENTETLVKKFDGANLNDLYGVASAVVAKLDATSGMQNRDRARLVAKPTQNREAYAEFQRGNYFYNHSWEEVDVRAALTHYYQATRLDPSFALAFAALGRAHGWIYQLGIERTDAHLRQAKAAIDSAFKLAPDLPEAHLALGLYRYWAARDYDGALSEFAIVQRALPSSAETFNFMGNIQRRKGLLKEAAQNYELSSDLDPAAYQTIFNRAEVLLYLRQFDEAEGLVNRVMELAPDFIDGPLLKATLQIHRSGNVATARRILADLATRIPPPTWRRLGHHWRAGLFRIVDDNTASADQRIRVGSYGLDTAQYYIAKADEYRRFGPPARATAYYDSAAAYMDATVQKHPERADAYGQLAIAYAGLHKKDEALRAAAHSLEMINETTDALDGPEWLANIAQVYAMLGDVPHAVDSLAKVVKIPSRLSPKWVALDPIWTPLHDDARFKSLAPPVPGAVALRSR